MPAGLLLGLSLPVAEAAKEQKGGAPAKYPHNAKAVQILLRTARDASPPTTAEIRTALERAGGDWYVTFLLVRGRSNAKGCK